MTPSELEHAWDALGDTLSTVRGTSAEVGPLNAAISQWQDFYWGNYEQWPADGLRAWESKYAQVKASINELITARGAGTPIVAAETTEVVKEGPIEIFATWPLWMKVSAGVIAAFLGYKVLSKLKIL